VLDVLGTSSIALVYQLPTNAPATLALNKTSTGKAARRFCGNIHVPVRRG
jgi:hypothetical protein